MPPADTSHRGTKNVPPGLSNAGAGGGAGAARARLRDESASARQARVRVKAAPFPQKRPGRKHRALRPPAAKLRRQGKERRTPPGSRNRKHKHRAEKPGKDSGLPGRGRREDLSYIVKTTGTPRDNPSGCTRRTKGAETPPFHSYPKYVMDFASVVGIFHISTPREKQRAVCGSGARDGAGGRKDELTFL